MLRLVLRLLLTAFLCVLLVGFGLCGVQLGRYGDQMFQYVFALVSFAIAGLLIWLIVRLWTKPSSPPPPPPPPPPAA